MEKELLEGYVGVKFTARRESRQMPDGASALYDPFFEAGRQLASHHMAPKNGGNMSVRLAGGFVVTASGCNLRHIEPDELVFVVSCDVERAEVAYRGHLEPSSESIMHHMIYLARPEALAVVHAHDPAATPEAIRAAGLCETVREEPYGTVELAVLAIETFARDRPIIVLCNHGYVSCGDSLEGVTDLIVTTHQGLVALGNGHDK